MRITNWKHIPWFLFVVLATMAAALLYIGNFHPERMPAGIHLPAALIQTPSEHHTVGGTPLGLWFGAISLAIFVFAALLSLRKKIPLWRIGTVQRWLRAHIWLTLLTIPLVILHSGFRHAPHGALRHCHGERHLRALSPASHASRDERPAAARNGLRGDPGHSRPVGGGGEKNARFAQVHAVSSTRCRTLAREHYENGSGRRRSADFCARLSESRGHRHFARSRCGRKCRRLALATKR
jgi:hypothetical protein